MPSELTKATPETMPQTSSDELQLKAFTDAAADAVARTLAGVQKEAQRAEELRQAEYRAFFAEQRETVAGLIRKVEERLSQVKDGADGKDGRDADMDALTRHIEALVKAIPVPENGKDGRDGEPGPQGVEGPPGKDGEPGPAGSDGANGADGRDGIDGKDADMDALQNELTRLVAAFPIPKDGKDGADAYPGMARGLYDPKAEYRALDTVSFNGSEWRAKCENPGELPGPDWMLSASKGKRGDKGERGERGLEGKSGKDGAQPVGLAIDAETMEFRMILDSGEECAADFYPIAKAIRGE